MAEHNDLGNQGERLAADFLVRKGYKIRHQNWISGKKELDIVAENDEFLVIVEVKTRSTDNFEHPQEAITSGKIKNLVCATEEYIFRFDIMKETRFDIISVIPERDGTFRIEHIEDAFLPPVN